MYSESAGAGPPQLLKGRQVRVIAVFTWNTLLSVTMAYSGQR